MKNYHRISAYIGSFLLTILLIPEVIQVIKNKNAKELAWPFLIIQAIMPIFFLIFATGIHQDSGLSSAIPSYISNTMSFIFTIILMILKKKYEKNE